MLGGTCTNYGCDAKILLDSPLELKEALDRYQQIGLSQRAALDWSALMAYKKAVIGMMPQAMAGIFGQFGIEVLRGDAVFRDANTIEVDGKTYTAKHFVIGTGQDYIPLDIEGKEYFHNSREFLSLDVIPDHVTFVGAGIISMEFASICLGLGIAHSARGIKVDEHLRTAVKNIYASGDVIDKAIPKLTSAAKGFVQIDGFGETA